MGCSIKWKPVTDEPHPDSLSEYACLPSSETLLFVRL
jgi:hypothetical protein